MRRHAVLVWLLIAVTLVWAGLYGKALWDSSDGQYQLNEPRTALVLSMFVGVPLYGAWIVMAAKHRSLWLACTATGALLVFGFFLAANTRGTGYTVEYLMYIGDSPGDQVRLNPLLHLGGETHISHRAAELAFVSSMSIPNQLLYLAYGELISFAIAGLGLLSRRLARIIISKRFSPSRLLA